MFYVLMKGRTIGDKLFKTKIVEETFLQNDISISQKYYCNMKWVILPFIFINGYLIYVYLFVQKLNYYSVRIIFTLVIMFIIFMYLYILKNEMNKLKKLNLAKEQFKFLYFSLLFLSVITFFVPVEKYIFEFAKLNDSFEYSYPNNDIFYKYEYDEYGFVLFNFENVNMICYYEKNGDRWSYCSPYDLLSDDTYVSQQKTEQYELLYSKASKYDKVMIAIIVPNSVRVKEVDDSLNSKFEIKNINGYTYYTKVITLKEFSDYYVLLDDEKVFY